MLEGRKTMAQHARASGRCTTVLMMSLGLLFLPRIDATVCNRTTAGTSAAALEGENCVFIALHELFYSLLEENPEIATTLTSSDQEAIFHEGPVLFREDQELFFTTNRLGNTSLGPVWGDTAPAQLDQFIDIYRLDLSTNTLAVLQTDPPILMANGMTKSADGQNILALSQGFGESGEGGGVHLIDRSTRTSANMYSTTPIVTSYYGIPFNSLNDMKTTQDGRYLFLTDPVYGFEQGFRQGVPQLGTNVYRYDTTTKELQILVTSLQRPNGIALLEDDEDGGCTLFVSDSGFESVPDVQSPRGFDGWSDAAIYYLRDDKSCFDPANGPFTLQPLVVVGKGIQDGIHVHPATRTLWYCDGDGLWVWSIGEPELWGTPLGLIPLTSGCTQLAFDPKLDSGSQTIYILAETRLLSVNMNFQPDKLFGTSDGVSFAIQHKAALIQSIVASFCLLVLGSL